MPLRQATYPKSVSSALVGYMKERRKYSRIVVKDGIFAVIAGNPYKVFDICVGGASFHCTGEQFVDSAGKEMEILVMNGNIHYIQDIKHSFLKVDPLLSETYSGDSRVRVVFQELTQHQSVQFQLLLGAC